MRLIGTDECSVYPQVTSDKLFIAPGDPDPGGIFSKLIFGSTASERTQKFGSIQLNTRLFHPSLWKLIKRVFKKYMKPILMNRPYQIKDGSIIIFTDESEVKGAKPYYGLPAFIQRFHELQIPDNKTGNVLSKIIDKYSDKLLVACIPVIPAGYREVSDENQLDPLNQAYINLIKYNRNILDTQHDPTNEIFGRYVNLMQLQIENIYNTITSKIGKKVGVIRSSLLGKRVDFSGRSVLVDGPELPYDHLGVPVRMAVKLYEPWVIRELTLVHKLTIDEALDLIGKVSKGYAKTDSEDYKLIKEVLQEVTKDRVILAKRDPALHRLSWQAFYVTLVDDNAIHMNPLIFSALNADVDGDQIGLFVPFTKEAQEEAYKLLNPVHSANPRRLKFDFSKDYKYGLCILTSDPPEESLQKKYWWWKQTTYNKIVTTQGRVKVLEFFTKEELDKVPIDDILTKKLNVDKVSIKLLENGLSEKRVSQFVDYLQKLVIDVFTEFSQTIILDDMKLSDKVKPLVDKLDPDADISILQKQLDEISSVIKKEISTGDTPLKYLFNCGVTKFGQLVQLLGVKGLVLSPDGSVHLIKRNFSDGLQHTDYFEAGHGARMGIVSRAQKTATTGYLQRQIIYALASVELDPNIYDCGTGKTLDLHVNEEVANRLINRYAIVDNNLIKITPENVKDIIGKRIKLRSPMYCLSKKVCTTCYGDDYKLFNTTKIGFLAAQSMGERFTQEIMKAFHTGGTVSFKFYNPIELSSEVLGVPISKYEEIVEFKDKKLKCKQESIRLLLSKEYYNMRAFKHQLVDNNKLELEMIIGDFVSNNDHIPFAYDEPVILYVPDEIQEDEDHYTLVYYRDDYILETLPVTTDVESKAKRVLTILSGKAQFKDESHLLNQVLRQVQSFGDFVLVHLEVLLSQLLRCPDNLSLPYRLCNTFSKPATIVGIKKIPYLESWKRGLEFERVDEAITNALVNSEISQESLLDELL